MMTEKERKSFLGFLREKEKTMIRRAGYVLGIAILVTASLCLLPILQAADTPNLDSPEVSELLSQAISHANQLRDDADTMKTFSMGGLTWQSHANQINMIREQINNLGKVLKDMGDWRHIASPWQQVAIDRVTPLAQEMAANIEQTIEHLNNNQNRLHMQQYRDYLAAHYEVSSSLAKLINDLVEYGQNKARYESLGKTLELPGM
jgi:hypothetical protein